MLEDYENLKRIDGVHKVCQAENTVSVTVDKSKDNLNEIITVLLTGGRKMQSMGSHEASLEDVFLALTGKNLKD